MPHEDSTRKWIGLDNLTCHRISCFSGSNIGYICLSHLSFSGWHSRGPRVRTGRVLPIRLFQDQHRHDWEPISHVKLFSWSVQWMPIYWLSCVMHLIFQCLFLRNTSILSEINVRPDLIDSRNLFYTKNLYHYLSLTKKYSMRYLEEGIGLLTITVEGLRRLCQIWKWLKYLGIMMSLEIINSLKNLVCYDVQSTEWSVYQVECSVLLTLLQE